MSKYTKVINKLYNYKIIKQTVEDTESNMLDNVNTSLRSHLKNDQNTFENSIIRLLDDNIFQNNKKWLEAFKELDKLVENSDIHKIVLEYAFKENDEKKSDRFVLQILFKKGFRINKAIYYQVKRNIIIYLFNISKHMGLTD